MEGEGTTSSGVVPTFVRWINDAVIAHDLCPFAAASMEKASFEVCHGDDLEDAVLSIASRMIEDDEIETAFVVAPEGLVPFEDFLDAQAGVEFVLEESGADAFVLVAGFHPDYRFDGEDERFAVTNRSPFPAIHLIRQESFQHDMETAGRIVEKNQETISGLTESQLKAAWPHLQEK